MQSFVRSDAPRLPRASARSNDSVHISREVSVTSSRASSPPGRGSFATIPQIHSGHARKIGSSDAGSASGIPFRWASKASARSSAQYARSSMQSVRRIQSPDPEVLDNNRESMKALSEFLMSKEPPPNHFMSMHSSDDEKSLSSFKRSALKILGRKKKVKEKPQRLLQLPDSAVAAKTSGGARYIAISIPIEHDHLHKPLEKPLPPPRQSSQRTGERPERAAVTVLKPVVEVRESTSTYLSGARSKDSLNDPTIRVPELVTTPPNDVVGRDNAITLQKYYAQQNQQQRRLSAADMTPTSRRDPARMQRSYIAVSPNVMNRQEGDPRHSGGTAYSTTSIMTGQSGHSRGPSNASSSVTVISSLKLDLPPRNSSIAKMPKSHSIEHILHPLNQNPIQINPTLLERSHSSPIRGPDRAQGHVRGSSAVSDLTGIESIASVTSVDANSDGSTPSPPTVFVADIARKYSNAETGTGPHLVRSSTPRVVSGIGTPMPRPQTAPPAPPAQVEGRVPLSQFNEIPNMARRTVSQREGNVADPRQDRQERVKARKLRDMENIRPKSSGGFSQEIPRGSIDFKPNADTAVPPSEEVLTPPKRSVRRRRTSQELSRLRKANTISPIMLVAVLPPAPAIPVISKQSPTPTPSISTARYRPTSSQPHSRSQSTSKRLSQTENRTHTPPHSHTSSLGGSDTESGDDRESRNRLARMRSSSQSLRSTLLETRRQERRAKRNISLREKDLDTRMWRIERDNVILLRTLSGIAKSFDEMRRLGSGGELKRRARPGMDLGVVGEEEQKRRKDLEGMDTIMLDLNRQAPRVSAESQREGGGEGGLYGGYDEYDEDDGGSIL